MFNKKILAVGFCLISTNVFSYTVNTQVIENVPFPGHLKNIHNSEMNTKAIHLTAEGCDSQGKVNQYTVACGFYAYKLQNPHAGDAKYRVSKFICINEEICTYFLNEYVLGNYESVNVPKQRIDWTVKASKIGTYEVEAYIVVDGAEKSNAKGIGHMRIY